MTVDRRFVKPDADGSEHVRRPKPSADPEFQKRLRIAMGSRSRYSVAKAVGISHSLLGSYLTHTRPGADRVAKIAEVLGVSLDWLSAGKGPQQPASLLATLLPGSEIVRVPLYPVELGAGLGRLVWPSGEPVGHYDLMLDTVRGAHMPLSALAGFTVRGHSMEPEITDGDIAILDLSRTVLPPDASAIYGIRLDDELQLKRLRWVDNEVEISSINREFPPARIARGDAERLQIIGRFWIAFHTRPLMVQD